jgi:hypothetical protein
MSALDGKARAPIAGSNMSVDNLGIVKFGNGCTIDTASMYWG